MKRIASFAIVLAVFAGSIFASDLYVEAQFDITGKVPAKNYLTVKGATASVEKDTIDATTGASKAKGTEVLNAYRAGADKKTMLPGGLQSLFKYGVSAEPLFSGDKLTVAKAADGTITVQYCHRGTAYIMVSDKKGQFTLPGMNAKLRKIANLEADGSQTVAKEFSPTGKVADIVWAKVWDESIPDGTLIATGKTADGKTVEVKTGKVGPDAALSATPYAGVVQATLTGTVMTLKADLNIKK
jgi:hypothetical protein